MRKRVRTLCAAAAVFALALSPLSAPALADGGRRNPLAVEGVTLQGGSVIGTPFSASSDWNRIPLQLGTEVEAIKVWAYCETGGMNTRLVDADGAVIKPTQTLEADSDHTSFEFWFDRAAAYDGDYFLEVRGLRGYSATGWYQWIEV